MSTNTLKKLYVNKVTSDDIEWGIGTTTQIRAGKVVTLNKLNLATLPIDEFNSLQDFNDIITLLKPDLQGLSVIVSNMDEILLADDNANIATTKANEALNSANASEASRQISDSNKAATDANVVLTSNNVELATEQATLAIEAKNSALVSSLVVNAYSNLDWAGFHLVDGELNVEYFDNATSTPSLVDGEFIITY